MTDGEPSRNRGKRKKEFTWTRDSNGNPYIASVLTTADEGQSYQKQSKTEQTLDTHGNVTETKLYDYGNLTTPARTYTNTYVGGTEYTSKYIFNRLHTSTLAGGGQQVTLVHKQYDGLSPHYVHPRELDESLTWEHRGNATEVTANGVTTSVSYYNTGAVYSASSGGQSVDITLASSANYSAPSVITPNDESNLAETLTYTSFHGLATDTGPNSASSSRSYDQHARRTSSTSAQGATTSYTYDNTQAWTKATSNGRWTKTYMDGLGRTIKVETGYDTTIVSTAETEYDSCACSPLGKVKRTSLPYAPGGTVYWTAYTYDCLGRTLSVAQPGNSGTTTYVYEGNMVTVTDPAGKWKKYTSDALGNLVQVTEPNPGGNHETYYSYNLRGQLTGVSMPRGGTTQTRTFNYDLTTGRLSSAVNPENGTTSYTYNSNGTVASKTDAKNQQVQYTYDGFQRVTQIRRYPVSGGNEDACQQVNYTYDQGTHGWGRLYQASWGGESCIGGAWTHTYEYTASGLPTSKTQNDLTANYTWDNEGKMISVEYPYPLVARPKFTYTYDAMGRPVKLTDDQTNPVDWVKDVLYNQAGQVTEMKYTQNTQGSSYSTETRQYNVLQQMTRITVAGVLDQEYRFSDTANNGRITQKKDWVSGEEVTYAYDSLNRLISAETTGTEWGQSFSYDGFGNLLAQTVTKGSAPTLNVNVDPATNRITTGGYSYDSNGNLTAMPSLALSYDVENRVAQTVGSTTKRYVYDPGNLRVWKEGHVYFYGIEGNLLTTYGDGWNYDYNVYFGSKQIWQEAAEGLTAHSVNSDRLDSNVKHFPYGEESTTTTQNRTKFATYYRDSSTALDYARNRYYARTIGRFTSVDPLAGSLANPQSLNRYSYAGDDPVNFSDPTGLSIWGDIWGGVGSVVRAIGGWLGSESEDGPPEWILVPRDMSAGLNYKPPLTAAQKKAGLKDFTYRYTADADDAIKSTISRLSDLLQGSRGQKCAGWLQGALAGSNYGDQFATIAGLLDTLPLITGKALISGTLGSNASAVTTSEVSGKLILFNTNGGFYKSVGPFLGGDVFKTQIGNIQSNTTQARLFLLIHELGHLLSAQDFTTSDSGNASAQMSNNDLVWENCGGLLMSRETAGSR